MRANEGCEDEVRRDPRLACGYRVEALAETRQTSHEHMLELTSDEFSSATHRNSTRNRDTQRV